MYHVYCCYYNTLLPHVGLVQEIRTTVRDLEQTAREFLTVLQAMHQTKLADGRWAVSCNCKVPCGSVLICLQFVLAQHHTSSPHSFVKHGFQMGTLLWPSVEKYF